jgi:hypothetical protein
VPRAVVTQWRGASAAVRRGGDNDPAWCGLWSDTVSLGTVLADADLERHDHLEPRGLLARSI